MRERLDRFPTQLVLLLAWLVPGAAVSWLLRDKLSWTAFMSWYAIVVSHLTAHIAWRAKRAADAVAHAEHE